MTLLSRLPIMPLYYNGETKFSPIHVIDLVDIIFGMINSKTRHLTLECVGPEEITFKEILKKLLVSINKKRIFFPMPLNLAILTAKVLQLLPNPLLTEDQLKLLKYDNIKTGNYKTNFDFGYKTNRIFETEIKKYSFNWKNGGQFANSNEKNEI